MTLEILDEVAFLFVEQFDNLYGVLVDRTELLREVCDELYHGETGR